MWESLFNRFFGCAHRKTTFPLTCGGRPGSGVNRPRATYVTCLDCGAELAYDWDRMRLGAPLNRSELNQTRWTEWRIERGKIA